MGRPNKKVTTGVNKDDPQIGDDASLKKDAPHDQNS